jgi:heme/copper-type cytochrome/quinol oxidase subunit 2
VHLEFNDTSVLRGETYNYYVTAVNGNGESNRSVGIQVSALKEDGGGNDGTSDGCGLWIIIFIASVFIVIIATMAFFITRRRASEKEDIEILNNEIEVPIPNEQYL